MIGLWDSVRTMHMDGSQGDTRRDGIRVTWAFLFVGDEQDALAAYRVVSIAL